MSSSKPRFLRTVLASLAVLALLTLTSHSQAFGKARPTPTPTPTPTPNIDGNTPFAAPIMDTAGNLYGTTANGGAYANGAPQGDGTVFKLTQDASGGWTESVVHSFNGTDGKFPEAALIIDGSGNLYGATIFGGTSNRGTVFELSPNAGGWTESVLLSFNGTNGAGPHDALMMDTGGNLYGTAQSGGAKGYGTVFKLTNSGATWTPSVLHSFVGGLSDGAKPVYTRLIMDAGGNLYGTTTKGGAYSAGTIFELTPSGAEFVLYSFKGGTGDANSPGDLIFGATGGNFYGIGGGGTLGAGTVFSLPLSGGPDSVPYNFTGGSDGSGPKGVIADANSGNLFGTTAGGGANGLGTVFELTSGGLMSLCSFNGTNGNDPEAGLMMDSAGNLYGTTTGGGTAGMGTVFKLTNGGAAGWSESVLYSFK